MDISVLVEKKYKNLADEKWLESILERILIAENVKESAEVSLVITSQDKIRQLNFTYREIDEPTDVLSFGMLPASSSEAGLPFVTAPDGFMHLGEVIISYPQAEKQAEEHGHSIKKELATLTVHGVLHLLGYDHENPEDEPKMKAREEEILKQIENKL